MDLQQQLETGRVLILDGAMGTELQRRGLDSGKPPEAMNLEAPEMVTEIHRDYLKAGSDIIQTNTFGGNRIKLERHGLGDKTEAINRRAVELAREQSDQVLVSGSIGPTGKLMEPMGMMTFAEAYEVFAEQARILAGAGVDLINIETMTDLQEARSAVIAVKENTPLPVICNLTYTENLTTITGTDPRTAVAVFEALGVDVIGVNCSLGPEQMIEVVKELSRYTQLPISYQPNAGQPVLEDGETVFPMEAGVMADYAPDAVAAGAGIVGGCCGSTPAYIDLIASRLKDLKRTGKSPEKRAVVAGRRQTVDMAGDRPTPIVSPRLNYPEARGNLRDIIKEQVEAGARILKLGQADGVEDPEIFLKKALQLIHNLGDIPVVLDVDDPQLLEVGLQNFVGKPLIGLSGSDGEGQTRLALARKYGAALLARKAADNADQALEMSRKLEKQALDLGINQQDIIIEVRIAPDSSLQNYLRESLRALQLIHTELGLKTALPLRVADVFGQLKLTDRVKSTLLAMAINTGVDLVIFDPTSKNLKETLSIADQALSRVE
ncbi:MAG: homocysteine S-methyltransferase family protein [Bacillota bacterium]